MDARGVVLNIAWKGLVLTEKIEEITVIGLMLTQQRNGCQRCSVKHSMERSRFHYENRGAHYHRFNVNLTAK